MLEEIENLTEKQKERFFKSVCTIFRYSDEEIEALSKPELTTQEIFEKCLDTCIAMDDVEEFFDVQDEFPQFARAFVERVEKELDASASELEEEIK